MIIKVFIDESGTHGSHVTILGGWVARLGQWCDFDRKWRTLLKRNEVPFFHGKELRHGKGPFKGWSQARKDSFVQQVAKTSVKHLSFGFTISVYTKEYNSIYIGSERLKGVAIDSAYGLCFRHCLGMVPTLAMQQFRLRPDQTDMFFVLESGAKNQENARHIFNEIRGLRNPDAEERPIIATLRDVSFAEKAAHPGLQAADANAYANFQSETRNPLETVMLEDPANAVAEAVKLQKTPVFRLHIDADLLGKYRQILIEKLREKDERRSPRTTTLDAHMRSGFQPKT